MNPLSKVFRQWNLRVSLNPQEFRELLLSHHPNMPCFDDEVIILFHRRVCAGCLLAYPTSLLVLFMFHPFGLESVLFALLFAGISQIRRLSKNIIVNHGCRLLAGIALGFGIGGGFWALINSQWFAVFALSIGAIVYLILKVWSIKTKLLNSQYLEYIPAVA